MKDIITSSYIKMFGKSYTKHKPFVDNKLLNEFPEIEILEFPKDRLHKAKIFATNGMNEVSCHDECLPEVYIYSYSDDDIPLKALSMFIEYAADNEVKAGNIFSGFSNQGAVCNSVVLAYPMPDGEGFPEIYNADNKEIFFLWLLPVTEKERLFIEQNGLDAFEDMLIEKDPLYYGWDRQTIVE